MTVMKAQSEKSGSYHGLAKHVPPADSQTTGHCDGDIIPLSGHKVGGGGEEKEDLKCCPRRYPGTELTEKDMEPWRMRSLLTPARDVFVCVPELCLQFHGGHSESPEKARSLKIPSTGTTAITTSKALA